MSDDMIRPAGDPNDVSNEIFDPAELELITAYLQNRLPPEQVAEVKRRLDEDATFREFAAPLVLAWSVRVERKLPPMSRVELVKQWDDFTKRAGFVHQRAKARRRRRRWMLGTLVTLATLWVTMPKLLPTRGTIWLDMAPVPEQPDSAGWVLLGNGARARLQPGAKLYRRTPGGPVEHTHVVLRLEGSARFVIERPAHRAAEHELGIFIVHTEAGTVTAVNDEDFVVRAREDTTDVEVFSRAKSPPPRTREDLDMVSLEATHAPYGIIDVVAGERGRLQVGSAPLWLSKVYRVVPGVLPVPPVAEERKAAFVPLSALPDSAGWISIGTTSRVLLDPGARLLRPRTLDEHKLFDVLWLEGSARVVRELPSDRSSPAWSSSLTVKTDAGDVIVASDADILLSARGETTDVDVRRRRERPGSAPKTAIDSAPPRLDVVMIVGGDPPVRMMTLLPGEIGRLRARVDPVRLRGARDVERNSLIRWLFR